MHRMDHSTKEEKEKVEKFFDPWLSMIGNI